MKTRIFKPALLFFALVVVSSCSNIPEYEVGQENNTNSNRVYFPEQETSLTLALEQDSFEVKIARKNFSKAAEIPITYISTEPDLFTGPQSVRFQAGDSIESIFVRVNEIELITPYVFGLQVGDVNQYDNPYTVGSGVPMIAYQIVKEDFVPYCNGIFKSSFFDSEWDMVLEYSAATEQFRFKDLWSEGYDLYFKWDGQNDFEFIGNDFKTGASTVSPAVPTGMVHPDYGPIWASFNLESTFDILNQTIHFNVFYVDAGSPWGEYTETYEISDILIEL